MTISEPQVKDTVRSIIENQLNFAIHGHELGPDDNLWDLGMTSLTCLGLMLAIEDTCNIELPEDSLKESTFRSVNTITAAVENVRNGGSELLAEEGVPPKV
jgi:acyl carrier protein